MATGMDTNRPTDREPWKNRNVNKKKTTIAERFLCVKEGNRQFEYFILERGIKRMKTNSEKQTDQLEKKENKRKRNGKENAFFYRSYRERNNLTRSVSFRYTRL